MENTPSENMQKVLEQEEETTLDYFDKTSLATIASYLFKQLNQSTVPLTVRITFRDGQILFHYSANGCAADKDNWVRRKTNTVLNFGHSSQWFYYKTGGNHDELTIKYGLSLTDYTTSGGAVPIFVKDVGLVGAIAVSGFSGPWDDHDLAIDALRFLKADQNSKR